MTNKKKYINPPLVEAVFEFFYHSNDWSPIIPGIFYSEIKDKFPNITKNQGGFGISFDNNGIKIGGGGSNELTQYRNESNNTLIQLSNNLLTVNKLPEYDGWDSYLETIKFAINALNRVLNVEKINRIGLKAINKIEINSHSYNNFKKYFTIYPLIPKNIKTDLSSIQLNFETPIIDKTEILAISLATLRKEPNYEAPVMFQLYVTRIREIENEKIEQWLESSHKIIVETFENSLTENCKNNFNNVQ